MPGLGGPFSFSPQTSKLFERMGRRVSSTNSPATACCSTCKKEKGNPFLGADCLLAQGESIMCMPGFFFFSPEEHR